VTEPVVLPVVVAVSDAFARRIPSPRLQRVVRDVEGRPFQEVMAEDPFRVAVFRLLHEQFPDFDLTALWLHSFDVEAEVVEPNPTNGASPTPAPPSATTGASGPRT
jgi:hypothetical protein